MLIIVVSNIQSGFDLKASEVKIGDTIKVFREWNIHLDPYHGVVDIPSAKVEALAISQSNSNVRYLHLGKHGWLRFINDETV